MRNLKKVLSLALALVMLLGMMVVGAGATSFKDDADIQNKEAVAVLVGMGIMKGREDGSNFEPNGTLTRAEAAKMIAQLDLGVEAADALKANGTNPFSDVWSGYWAGGAIDYCVEQGYINGDGNGHFFPNQKVTGVQFASMLLRLLGYDAKIEGLVGDKWAVNAAALARKAGLTTKVMANNEDMTRDGMAQMSFNALTASMVEYEGMDITIGDVAINARAKVRTHTGSTIANVANTTYDGEDILANITPIRFCEERFPDLKLDRTTLDSFKRTCSVWTWKKVAIAGTKVAITPDAEFTAKTKASAVSAAINGATGTTATLYVNGKTWDETVALDSALIAALTQNGRQVQVYLKAHDHKTIDKVVVVDTYVGRVNSVSKDGTDDRYITLAILGKNSPVTPCAPSAAELKADKDRLVSKTGKSFIPVKTFETASFAAGDLVTYQAAWASDGKYYIQEVDALEVAATATLEKWVGYSVVADSEKGNSESSFTAGGTEYKYSVNDVIVDEDGLPAENDIASFTATKSEINIYLDKYNYVIYVSGVETPKNYAAVIGVGKSNQYGSETRGATLLLPDGTKKEVTAKADPWSQMLAANGENLVSDGFAPVVTYSESDGVYTLTPAYKGSGASKVNTGLYNSDNRVRFTNGKSGILIADKATDAENAGDNYYTTSKTVFMVGTSDSQGKYTYSVFTGYADMPTVKWAKVNGVSYALNRYYPNQVDVVYIDGTVEGMAAYTYFVINRNIHPITTVDSGIYSLPAVVSGEKTTIEVKATAKYGTKTVDELDPGLYVVTDVTKDKNGVITAFQSVAPATAFKAECGKAGTIALDGTVLGFGNKNSNASYWSYTDSTKIFMVEEDFSDLEPIDIRLVANDKNDLVYAGRESTERKLTNVFIVEQDDDKTTTGSLKLDPSGNAALNTDFTVIDNGDGTYTVEAKSGKKISVASVANCTVEAVTANTKFTVKVTDTTKDATIKVNLVDLTSKISVTAMQRDGVTPMLALNGKGTVRLESDGKATWLAKFDVPAFAKIEGTQTDTLATVGYEVYVDGALASAEDTTLATKTFVSGRTFTLGDTTTAPVTLDADADVEVRITKVAFKTVNIRYFHDEAKTKAIDTNEYGAGTITEMSAVKTTGLAAQGWLFSVKATNYKADAAITTATAKITGVLKDANDTALTAGEGTINLINDTATGNVYLNGTSKVYADGKGYVDVVVTGLEAKPKTYDIDIATAGTAVATGGKTATAGNAVVNVTAGADTGITGLAAGTQSMIQITPDELIAAAQGTFGSIMNVVVTDSKDAELLNKDVLVSVNSAKDAAIDVGRVTVNDNLKVTVTKKSDIKPVTLAAANNCSISNNVLTITFDRNVVNLDTTKITQGTDTGSMELGTGHEVSGNTLKIYLKNQGQVADNDTIVIAAACVEDAAYPSATTPVAFTGNANVSITVTAHVDGTTGAITWDAAKTP